MAYVKGEVGVGISFDVIHQDLKYLGRDMSLFVIDGMIKDEIMHFIMKLLSKMEPSDIEPDPLDKLLKTYILYVEVSSEKDLDKAVFLANFRCSGIDC